MANNQSTSSESISIVKYEDLPLVTEELTRVDHLVLTSPLAELTFPYADMCYGQMIDYYKVLGRLVRARSPYEFFFTYEHVMNPETYDGRHVVRLHEVVPRTPLLSNPSLPSE